MRCIRESSKIASPGITQNGERYQTMDYLYESNNYKVEGNEEGVKIMCLKTNREAWYTAIIGYGIVQTIEQQTGLGNTIETVLERIGQIINLKGGFNDA